MEMIISVIGVISLSIVPFIATNIDDIVVLSLLFSLVNNNDFTVRHVVIGQYLGMIVLIISSLLMAIILQNKIDATYLKFLGLVPLALGIHTFCSQENDNSDDDTAEKIKNKKGPINAILVAMITIANGGDNIAIYTPLFVDLKTTVNLGICIVTFLVLVGVWCYLGRMVTKFYNLERVLIKNKKNLTAIVFIALGLWIIH